MGIRVARPRPDASSDVKTVLTFAAKFLERARAVEERAATQARQKNEDVKSRMAAIRNLASPMHNPEVLASFSLELFGFIAAIRSTRDYVGRYVARGSGRTCVQDTRLKTDVVVFHQALGNLTVHESMIDPNIHWFIGGESDGKVHFCYDEYEIGDRASKAFHSIQDAHPKNDVVNWLGANPNKLGIIDLGSMVLTELEKLHDECLINDWYRTT